MSAAADFDRYLRETVRHQLLDADEAKSFEDELSGLATTGMATDTLRRLLASAPEREPWEVGEALAECLVRDEYDAVFPWHSDRDKRTPKASLAGADLVGFVNLQGQVLLLLGEVKTSGDKHAPPAVMYGRSGVVHQLDLLATTIAVHLTLLKWLRARCRDETLRRLFQAAASAYLASGGRAMVLYGFLMRDTEPNHLDLSGRAVTLAASVASPTKVELSAWYLPRPVSAWVTICLGESE